MARAERVDPLACVYCGVRVDVDSYGAWREVRGWVQRRKAGGTNSVHDQEETGRYCCFGCMDLIRKGIPTGQRPMW